MASPGSPKKKLVEHWQIIVVYLVIYDIVMANLAYFLALWFRFDCVYSHIPPEYLNPWKNFIPVYSIVCVLIFWFFRLYNSMWRFASFPELVRITTASLLASALHVVLIVLLEGKWLRAGGVTRMPYSYSFVGAVFQYVFITGIRFSYRLLIYLREIRRNSSGKRDRVMLIGAGDAGQMILRDIANNPQATEKVCCIIDDNSNKWGRYIHNVPIVGGRESILENVEKYEINKIYLAIPGASAEERRDILNICKETECELKNLPGIYQLVSGEVTVNELKPVSIEDLLGRQPIQPEMQEVFAFISGKVILVTGGGGSIGSELCRQIAAHSPKQLIIFDVYENNAYEIQNELRESYPDLNLVTLIGSVRDSRRMFQVFEEYHPQIVYHAAAHKHVPLMEDSPNEAIKNNSIGTYKTAYAAMAHGCERFVLISTDKAVNPTNIMGASKRLCEMIIQAFDEKIKAGKAPEIPQLFTHLGDETAGKKEHHVDLTDVRTEFVAVRFGNVLGSNGSVVPIFKKQIARGGPVTVTHPDIIRYFMTVPEAVRLVMLAGTYAHGGEIFVLDMGSPVKIDTLARNLIRLSGLKPDVDIEIKYTGLRPGEKLYEEKLMAEEGLRKTENELIHIGCPIPFNTDEFLAGLDGLMRAAYNNRKDIKDLVAGIVTTYHPRNPEITVVKDGRYQALMHEDEADGPVRTASGNNSASRR